MTIVLSTIIPKVRGTLSDVPSEFLTNKQILIELEKAQAFCDMITEEGIAESFLSKCYEVVAAYYSYVNYTTLSERQLGTLPPTSKIRVDSLRSIAVSFLQLVSKYPLSKDLTLDMEHMYNASCAQVVLTKSVVDDD